MKLRSIVYIVLAILLLGSCTNDYQKITVNSCKVSSATEFGLSKGKMRAALLYEVNLDNASKSKFEVVEANAFMFDKSGTEFAIIALAEPVTIAAGNLQRVMVPVEITLIDPLYVFTNGSLVFKDNTADITIKVRQNGIMAKTIERKKVPVNSLMKRFKMIQ